jgi:hypothetical protein
VIHHLRRLNVTNDDVLQMRLDLLAAIKRSNNDLIHSFRGDRNAR